MLVQIQGNIIDTEQIWKISNLNKNNKYWPRFDISFFNNKSLRIEIRIDVPSEAELFCKKLEIARQELINYWNKSKSTIPEIKIE